MALYYKEGTQPIPTEAEFKAEMDAYHKYHADHMLDIQPNTIRALDFIETLTDDARVELRDDWADWLSGPTKKSCINYLKLFAPGAYVSRAYKYDDRYEVYL